MIDWTAAGVFIGLFVVVTGVGFYAANWRQGEPHSAP